MESKIKRDIKKIEKTLLKNQKKIDETEQKLDREKEKDLRSYQKNMNKRDKLLTKFWLERVGKCYKKSSEGIVELFRVQELTGTCNDNGVDFERMFYDYNGLAARYIDSNYGFPDMANLTEIKPKIFENALKNLKSFIYSNMSKKDKGKSLFVDRISVK